jgi:hypothetical protein
VFVPELSPYRNPADLLRRFAPTPIKTTVHLGFARVLLETNDLSLLPSLPFSGPTASSPTCAWKLVRDVDATCSPAEVSIVMAGSLIVYSMGPACLIGADRERKQILAFIGVEVDARLFQESILPALCRLTRLVIGCPETAEALPSVEVIAGDQSHG